MILIQTLSSMNLHRGVLEEAFSSDQIFTCTTQCNIII
jgi:hypothetical protein